MHVVDGSTIHVQIALNRGLLSRAFLKAAATISATALESDQEVEASLEDWVVQVEEHGADDDVADDAEPGCIEVSHRTTCEAKANRLLAQVSIDQEQEEG